MDCIYIELFQSSNSHSFCVTDSIRHVFQMRKNIHSPWWVFPEEAEEIDSLTSYLFQCSTNDRSMSSVAITRYIFPFLKKHTNSQLCYCKPLTTSDVLEHSSFGCKEETPAVYHTLVAEDGQPRSLTLIMNHSMLLSIQVI